MLDGAQKFHTMTFFLEGIVRGRDTLYLYRGGFNFQRLFCLRGQYDFTSDNEGCAYILPSDFLIIFQYSGIQNHLQIFEAGAVIQLHKTKGFHITDSTSPATDSDSLTAQRLLVRKNCGNGHTLHSVVSPFLK